MKKTLSSLAVALLLTGGVFADSPLNVVDKIDQVEKTLYAHVHEGAIVDRLGQIELTIWGKETKGQVNEEVDKVYKAVEFDGAIPSLRTKVDMLEWTYSGKLTDGSLIDRLDTIERGVFGRVSTKNVAIRVQDLEKSLLGNDKKIILNPANISSTTTFKVTLNKAINSQTNQVGDKIPFTVAEDIMDGNLLVVPEGTQGTAVITELQKARSFGRKATLDMRFDDIMTLGNVAFNAQQGQEALERSKSELQAAGASVAGIAILGPVGIVGGFFVKGQAIEYPTGQALYVQPVEDISTYGAGLAEISITNSNAKAEPKTVEKHIDNEDKDSNKEAEENNAPDKAVVVIKKS